MLKKILMVMMTGILLTACSSDKPRIIQAGSDMTAVRLTEGMATQIELPNNNRVQSIVVGNPSLVTADHTDNVVNLLPKEGSGETNLIVRGQNSSGEVEIYHYRIVVQGH